MELLNGVVTETNRKKILGQRGKIATLLGAKWFPYDASIKK